MKRYQLAFAPEARDDLNRPYDFLADIDLQRAERAIRVIESALDAMQNHPHTCRKAVGGDMGSLWRELVISFGSTGYVALFEITATDGVTVMAVRHQRESDYH